MIIKNIALKVINLIASHTSQASVSRDNFEAIQHYINDLRGVVKTLQDGTSNTNTATTTQIKNVLRDDMIKVAELNASHIDGITVNQTNGLTVTRSGNSFVIQTPDNQNVLLHGLREKTSRTYAQVYDVTVDNSNQVTISFSPFIKQDLELILFG